WIRWSPGSHNRHGIRDPTESEGLSPRSVAARAYNVVSEQVLGRVADKGKAPMSEEEPRELPTQARRVAVTIRELNIPSWTAHVSSSEDR
ncbi:hypothetical protein ACLOJK_019683, partial [Asimina triloba]